MFLVYVSFRHLWYTIFVHLSVNMWPGMQEDNSLLLQALEKITNLEKKLAEKEGKEFVPPADDPTEKSENPIVTPDGHVVAGWNHEVQFSISHLFMYVWTKRVYMYIYM